MKKDNRTAFPFFYVGHPFAFHVYKFFLKLH